MSFSPGLGGLCEKEVHVGYRGRPSSVQLLGVSKWMCRSLNDFSHFGSLCEIYRKGPASRGAKLRVGLLGKNVSELLGFVMIRKTQRGAI